MTFVINELETLKNKRCVTIFYAAKSRACQTKRHKTNYNYSGKR